MLGMTLAGRDNVDGIQPASLQHFGSIGIGPLDAERRGAALSRFGGRVRDRRHARSVAKRLIRFEMILGNPARTDHTNGQRHDFLWSSPFSAIA
jgi:hypothetical protein